MKAKNWDAKIDDVSFDRYQAKFKLKLEKLINEQVETALKDYASDSYVYPGQPGKIIISIAEGYKNRLNFSEFVDNICDGWDAAVTEKWAKVFEQAAKRVKESALANR